MMIQWTKFSSIKGSAQERIDGTWAEIIETVQAAKGFASKEACPLLKLAVFGDRASPKGSLRTDANLQQVTGIEGDYDSGLMSPEEAVALLESAGIRAMVYTSASHTAARPRWRVLAPLSRPVDKAARAGFVARINGVLASSFGAELAPESFTASQSYFFGAVRGAEYKVLVTFGDANGGICIDEAIGLPEKWPGRVSEQGERSSVSGDERLRQWLDTIASGASGMHEALRNFAASLIARGMPEDEVKILLQHQMSQSHIVDTPRWKERYGEIPSLVHSASLKFGSEGFSEQVAAIQPQRGRFQLMSPTDLLARPPLAWLIKGVIPTVGVVAIYGQSGSGKTFLALDMAAAIASGGWWFHKRVKATPTVYAALEGEEGIAQRLQAMQRSRGGGVPCKLQLLLQSLSVVTPQDIADLAAVVPSGAVIFIDTLNRAAVGVDENGSEGMGKILDGAKTLQRMTGGLVVLVHHSGKDQAKGMRGHSSLFAAMDGVIEVVKSASAHSWSVTKSKDSSGDERYGFRLKSVDLGVDLDGDAITSCVVEQQDYVAPAPKLSPQQEHALEVLKRISNGGSSHVSTDSWLRAFRDDLPEMKLPSLRTAFNRARTVLVESGVVSAVGEMNEISLF